MRMHENKMKFTKNSEDTKDNNNNSARFKALTTRMNGPRYSKQWKSINDAQFLSPLFTKWPNSIRFHL